MLVSIGIPPSVFSIFPAGILSKREKSWSDKTDFRSDEKCALEHVPTGLKRKKARNINGFRAFGKWRFSAKTVFQRLILGHFTFWSALFSCPGGDSNERQT